jgi:hypothetical protein
MPFFHAQTPLGQLKAWLRAKADEGTTCPLCEQTVKVYRRKITSTMARSLIEMYRAAGKDWAHLPTVISSQRADEGKLAYWGLLEEEKVRRPDGGRAGYWRVTDLGELFIQGNLAVPKYARVYNGRCLSLVTTEKVTIKDALGTKFDYAELMAGV